MPENRKSSGSYDPDRQAGAPKQYADLRKQYIIRLSAAYLVPLVLLALYFFYQQQNVLNESRRVRITSIAVNQSNLIDMFLKERLFTIDNLFNDEEFPVRPSSGYMETILHLLRLESDTFVDVGFFDERGILNAYSGPEQDLLNRDYSASDWYERLNNGDGNYIITDVHLGYRRSPHISVAVRKPAEGGVHVLRATVDPERFYEYINDLSSPHDAVSYIINRKGDFQTIVPIGLLSDSTTHVIPPTTPGMGTALAPAGGATRLYAYAWLNMADWALILQPVSTGYLPGWRDLVLNLLLVTLTFITVIFVVIVFQAKKLVSIRRESDFTRVQLEHAERMASIGRLAAGVAHEINNPLTGVLTSGHLLLRKTPEGHADREDLEIIVTETTRCREIIRSLLDFARQIPPKKVNADLRSVVEQSLSVLGSELQRNSVVVKTDFPADLPTLPLDVNQIEQVIVNLILNAIEAMPKGGRIDISAAVDDANLCLMIGDTGEGISEKHLRRVFDPFFTTKSAQKGTGLGLAVSYGIIRKHSGMIEVKSTLNKGTEFTITLPLEA